MSGENKIAVIAYDNSKLDIDWLKHPKGELIRNEVITVDTLPRTQELLYKLARHILRYPGDPDKIIRWGIDATVFLTAVECLDPERYKREIIGADPSAYRED